MQEKKEKERRRKKRRERERALEKKKEKKRKEKKRKRQKERTRNEIYQENSGLCVKRTVPTSWGCQEENKLTPRKALQKFMTTHYLCLNQVFL